MEYLIIVFIGICVALLFYVMIESGKKAQFVRDPENFKNRKIAEIAKVLGAPNSVSAAPEGALYQWISMSSVAPLHIAVLVDRDGNALGLTHFYAG